MSSTKPLQASFRVQPLAQPQKHADAIILSQGEGRPALALAHDFQCQVSARKCMMVGQRDADGSVRKFVEIDLNGTFVGPLQPISTTPALMGPFTDEITVTMAPQHDALRHEWDDPYASNKGHTSTHSVSFQASASGGSFGGQGIGNANAGFAVTDAESMTYTDWDVTNHTVGSTVTHEYFMSAAGPNAYDRDDPGSGVFPPEIDKPVGERLADLGHELDTTLHTPPELSRSNFPIVSHALWSTGDLHDTVTVSISVTARFVVVGRVEGLLAEYHRATVSQTWETSATVPLGDIGP